MKLEGSCHCGAVRFRCQSSSPVPYQRCYCTICRKQQGGGGYAINLGADANSMVVEGDENITVYRATMEHGTSSGERNFCSRCGCALWLFDPSWPDLIHPFASAIDTDLPEPPTITSLMLNYKANWAEVHDGPGDRHFDEYPDESLAEWHERHEWKAP
ncbi:GFA family protein [Notoacmeibacter sp. MSK16QG-6]|uniref:GFA family protein n=1 Tax=Notoacmeibacter sp. MSK16QG-6 TaxID=2957982 RepID=UPI00209F7731|nr:GFA family protein [Notoacmeibacter sp. MSK16QG-6]MCP1199412.1 GFA family protein [Notoacmeibacter sp. MSK16QG-6]